MGMFDRIIFEKAPIKCKCGNEITDFQTKDFSCTLDTYKVSKRNKFKVEKYRWELTEEFKKDESVRPISRKVSLGWKVLKLTDSFWCYEYCSRCKKWWFDIEMIWIKGSLDKLKVFKRRREYAKD